MNKAYSNLAYFYDKLQSDIDYNVFIDLIKNNTKNINTILEIGCGTGRLANTLSNNYKIEGFDLSSDMINIANKTNSNINLYVDNAITFKTNNKYDLVISFMDTLNYIVNISDLKQVFLNVYNCLNDDGYFIFDVHQLSNKELFDNYEEEMNVDNTMIKWNSIVINNLMKHTISFNENSEEHIQYLYSNTDIISCYEKYFTLIKLKNDDYKDYYILKRRSDA